MRARRWNSKGRCIGYGSQSLQPDGTYSGELRYGVFFCRSLCHPKSLPSIFCQEGTVVFGPAEQQD